MDETTGKALETLETASTALSRTACEARGVPDHLALDLLKLPDRLDDETMGTLRTIAALPIPDYAPSTRRHFDQCMAGLSILPRKADDDVKGKLRLNLYWRKLQHYPAKAMLYLVDRGLDEFDWFPTVKQCKEILDGWPAPRSARTWRSIARRKIDDELEKRWRDLRWKIRMGELDDEAINAMPERTKSRLDCDGLIIGERSEPGGPITYRVRPSVRIDAA